MVPSRADLLLMLKLVWLWLVDLWEFLVLLTLGFHPARNILTLKYDNKETDETVKTCLEMYRRSERQSSLSQLKDLLSTCHPLSIAQITTDDGYNLLQLAVQRDDIVFAEHLLRDRNVNPNLVKCSLPLHIAIVNGSRAMVELLLAHKAKPQQQAGMCYPQAHVPVYSSHSKFFFVSPSMVCGGASKDSYQRAIDADNVQLLQLLLEAKSSARRNVLLLHYACDSQAFNSAKHLVDCWGSDVNFTDSRGCNALMHSLLCDIDMVQHLVTNGADVGCISYQGQTVLHKLFSCPDELVPSIVEKTRLFLALGADNLVNTVDVFRNTPLHYLCTKYACNEDPDMETQLQQCLDLLLTHNADTSIKNADGKLPLLVLLECPCMGAVSRESEGGQHTHPHSLINNQAERIHEVVKLFSQANVKAIQSVINSHNETALFYVLRMSFCREDISYLDIMATMQSYGANINHVAVRQPPGNTIPTKYSDIHASSLISVVCERARVELQSVVDNVPLRARHDSLVTAVLAHLFSDGFDPNARQIECRTQVQAEGVQALACFIGLIKECRTGPQLSLIEEWLRVALQWGANPELQSYRPEPQICTSQSGIFLKQMWTLPVMECFTDSTTHHWSQNPDSLRRIVLLLTNCMSQTSLHHIITTTTCSSLHPVTGNRHLSQLAASLTAQPRTLQAMARQQIYRSMGRNVCSHRVASLPLPTALKNSISDIA